MRSPFAIGSKIWPGLSKLLETSSSVNQEIGKLISTGGLIYHWGGSNLRERLEDEIGNLLAAIGFVLFVNPQLDDNKIEARRKAMLDVFKRWHSEMMAGNPIGEDDLDRAMSAFGPLERVRSEKDFRTDMRAAIAEVVSVPGSVPNLGGEDW